MGGLLRCTIASVRLANVKNPKEGRVVECLHCSQSAVFRDGAWEWNKPEESE